MIRFRPEILVEISEVVVRPWNWRISISRRTPKVPIGFDNFAAAVAGVERVGFVAPNFWTVPLPDFVALTQVRMSSLRRPCEERCSISKKSRSVTRSTSPQVPRDFVDWLCVAKRRPEKKNQLLHLLITVKFDIMIAYKNDEYLNVLKSQVCIITVSNLQCIFLWQKSGSPQKNSNIIPFSIQNNYILRDLKAIFLYFIL
jgi:hypothetical protein